jgi:hypothetical protein
MWKKPGSIRAGCRFCRAMNSGGEKKKEPNDSGVDDKMISNGYQNL